MIEDKSTRPRSGSLFSHEDLSEATDLKVVSVTEDVNKIDSKDKPSTDTIDSADDIFSPVGTSSPVLKKASSSFAVDKDNVHIAGPRPRSAPRVIRRARSEILSRTTNIRPPLHQIIEEDSVSDFRNPRNSGTSSSPLLPATKTPTPKVIDQSGQSSAAEQGSQDDANGIRQRKVSGGGTTDGQDVHGRDGDGDIGGNKFTTPASGTNFAPEEQQQKRKKLEEEEEDGNHSIWQWLLRCLRRRST